MVANYHLMQWSPSTTECDSIKALIYLGIGTLIQNFTHIIKKIQQVCTSFFFIYTQKIQMLVH